MGRKERSLLALFPTGHADQNVVVSSQYYFKSKKGPEYWTKHANYLIREGVSKDGNGHGTAYDKSGKEIDIQQFVRDRILSSVSKTIWKVIISPEYGEALDLRRFTVNVLSRIEKEFGYKMDRVVFVEHHNRMHKHVHLIVSHESNHIPKKIMQHAIRQISIQEATRVLGPKPEISRNRDHEFRVGQWIDDVDRRILERGINGQVVYSRSDTPRTPEEHEKIREERSRLRHLAKLGLAVKLDYAGYEYSISPTLERSLKMPENVLEKVGSVDVLDQTGRVVPAFQAIGNRDVEIPLPEEREFRGKLIGVSVRDRREEDLVPRGETLFLVRNDDVGAVMVIEGKKVPKARLNVLIDSIGQNVVLRRSAQEITMTRDPSQSLDRSLAFQEERRRNMVQWNNEEELTLNDYLKKHPELAHLHKEGEIKNFLGIAFESMVLAGINVHSLFLDAEEIAKGLGQELKNHREKEQMRDRSER